MCISYCIFSLVIFFMFMFIRTHSLRIDIAKLWEPPTEFPFLVAELRCEFQFPENMTHLDVCWLLYLPVNLDSFTTGIEMAGHLFFKLCKHSLNDSKVVWYSMSFG